jgi:thiol:disulfide interchange protein DsbC
MKKILEKRTDIVFYLKMFPILSLHPKAYDKAKAIVCEESNEKAIQLLEDAYSRKKKLPAPSCETKVVDENIKLAGELGIRATPAMVFQDGRVVTGAMAADQLIKVIENKD